ncbi:MAG: T9SS type A sorting domain-containing protein [Candidatus Krumholzibacteria bacterium]
MQSITSRRGLPGQTSHTATGPAGKRPYYGCRGVVLATVLFLATASGAASQDVSWTHQFGSVNSERSSAVAIGATGVFVAGQIERGSLAGETSAGDADGFIRMYSAGGAVLWTRQFGTSSYDRPSGIATGASGIFVVGSTLGQFNGQVHLGSFDVFVRKYNADGSVAWTRQFGSSNSDEASGVAVHSGDIYVTGWTNGVLPGEAALGHFDAFVGKLDSAGNVVWVRQFGSLSFDRAYSVTANASGVYVTGQAGYSLPGEIHLGSADVFVRKYDFDGNEVWTHQFGTSADDLGAGVSVHPSGLYVVGRTSAALPGEVSSGNFDAFIRKYDTDGNEIWTHQFGWIGVEEAFGVSVDGSGAYVVGSTSIGLSSETSTGGADAFVRKFDLDGIELWTSEIGSATEDGGLAVSARESGTYAVGYTFGTLPDEVSAGGRDAFVMGFGVVEAPLPDLPVTMDILPGSCENPFNLEWAKHNQGNDSLLPVALVGGSNFDIQDVNPESVRLEGVVVPVRLRYEDVSSPAAPGDADCECSAYGPDGQVDLMLKFSRLDIVQALGLVSDREVRTLTLTGTLRDGTSFAATDCISVLSEHDAVLLDAAPNPFNPVTTINYVLLAQLKVRLDVFDIRGRLVANLFQGTQSSGFHSFRWAAEGQASGVYFYRLRAGDTVETGRVTLLK